MKPFSIIAAMLIILSGCSDDGKSESVPNLRVKESVNYDNPCAIAVSPSGKIAVTQYNGFENGYGADGKVTIYNTYEDFKLGNVANEFTNVKGPEGAVFNNTNLLYVTATEQEAAIKVYAQMDNYHIHSATVQDNFVNPRGMAIGNQNQLYVADDGNGRILHFANANASPVYQIVLDVGIGVKSVAVKDDILFYTHYNNSEVVKIKLNTDGAFLEELATLSVPQATDIMVHGNYVYVSSYEGGTVTVIPIDNFDSDHQEVYSELGSFFGMAYLPGKGVLVAALSQDKVILLSTD